MILASCDGSLRLRQPRWSHRHLVRVAALQAEGPPWRVLSEAAQPLFSMWEAVAGTDGERSLAAALGLNPTGGAALAAAAAAPQLLPRGLPAPPQAWAQAAAALCAAGIMRGRGASAEGRGGAQSSLSCLVARAPPPLRAQPLALPLMCLVRGIPSSHISFHAIMTALCRFHKCRRVYDLSPKTDRLSNYLSPPNAGASGLPSRNGAPSPARRPTRRLGPPVARRRPPLSAGSRSGGSGGGRGSCGRRRCPLVRSPMPGGVFPSLLRVPLCLTTELHHHTFLCLEANNESSAEASLHRPSQACNGEPARRGVPAPHAPHLRLSRRRPCRPRARRAGLRSPAALPRLRGRRARAVPGGRRGGGGGLGGRGRGHERPPPDARRSVPRSCPLPQHRPPR